MMNHHNIDKSAFRKGEYVGYCHGVWRIWRDGKVWQANSRTIMGCPAGRTVYGRTLEDISRELAELEPIIAAEMRAAAIPNPFAEA